MIPFNSFIADKATKHLGQRPTRQSDRELALLVDSLLLCFEDECGEGINEIVRCWEGVNDGWVWGWVRDGHDGFVSKNVYRRK